MTSHIIQDMERLIDDCIILDYGRILIQKPVRELMDTFSRYTFHASDDITLPDDGTIINPSRIRNMIELHTFLPREAIEAKLSACGIKPADLQRQPMTLEDAFIGLTGKY